MSSHYVSRMYVQDKPDTQAVRRIVYTGANDKPVEMKKMKIKAGIECSGKATDRAERIKRHGQSSGTLGGGIVARLACFVLNDMSRALDNHIWAYWMKGKKSIKKRRGLFEIPWILVS